MAHFVRFVVVWVRGGGTWGGGLLGEVQTAVCSSNGPC